MAFGSLEIKLPDGSSKQVILDRKQMIAGRVPESDIMVNDVRVSRQHLLFLCEPEGVRVVDMGSANGSYLDDVRLVPRQPVPLYDGAVLRIGQSTLLFSLKAQPVVEARKEAPPAVVPPPKPAVASPEKAKPEVAVESETRPKPATPVAPPPEEGAPPPAPEAKGYTPPYGTPRDRSTYLQYLPAIYSTDDLMGRYLLIFESIWNPIDRMIEHLDYFLDARIAPPDFLPWLASWLGLVLDERWPQAQRCELIRSAVELYDWRGTRRGLSEFIRLYTGFTSEIIEPGVGLKADPRQAFQFIVRVMVPDASEVNQSVLKVIIEAEKPAHAGYTLEVIPQKVKKVLR